MVVTGSGKSKNKKADDKMTKRKATKDGENTTQRIQNTTQRIQNTT